jgi:hypothetical protein
MLKDGVALTEADWKAYESFKLAIYSENAVTFAFLGQVYNLTAGWNVVEISSADMWAQVSSRSDCYENGYFWCQLNGEVDVYLDEFIGIYAA